MKIVVLSSLLWSQPFPLCRIYHTICVWKICLLNLLPMWIYELMSSMVLLYIEFLLTRASFLPSFFVFLPSFSSSLPATFLLPSCFLDLLVSDEKVAGVNWWFLLFFVSLAILCLKVSLSWLEILGQFESVQISVLHQIWEVFVHFIKHSFCSSLFCFLDFH